MRSSAAAATCGMLGKCGRLAGGQLVGLSLPAAPRSPGKHGASWVATTIISGAAHEAVERVRRPHLAFGDRIYLRLAQRDTLPLPGAPCEWEGRVVDVTHTTVTVKLPTVLAPRHCLSCAQAATLRGVAALSVPPQSQLFPELVAVAAECGCLVCTGCCRRVAADAMHEADAIRKRDGRRPAERVGQIGAPPD